MDFPAAPACRLDSPGMDSGTFRTNCVDLSGIAFRLYVRVHSPAGHFRPGVRLQQTLSGCLRLVRVNASIHRAYWGTGNTNALRLNVYFPCPLQCIEALTRTRLSINRVSAAGGLQAGSVQLSNEHELSKEPKCDTRQISNLMRVSLSISGESRRQAGLWETTCGKFLLVIIRSTLLSI